MKLKIKKAAINLDDTLYSRAVEVRFSNAFKVKFQGQTVDEIKTRDSKITLTFRIEREERDWGIKYLNLYRIEGPQELDVDVTVFKDLTGDSTETMSTQLSVNWGLLKHEVQKATGMVSIGQATLYLLNDPQGNLGINYQDSYIEVFSY